MTLTVRRARPSDAAALARIMGDDGVYPGLMQMPYANEAAWLARLNADATPGTLDLLLVAERDASDAPDAPDIRDDAVAPEVVGSAGLHPVGSSPRRRHAMVLGISVLPRAQGQGVGSALMRSLCDYADRWLGLLRLELTVYADNAAAIALYRKFGFFDEGRHVGYAMRHGAYVDTLAMARLHPAPPAIVRPAHAD